MSKLSISIVLYHDDKNNIKKTINSVLDSNIDLTLYLIDNSSNDNLKSLSELDKRIVYIYNDNNMGYGSAHNIAIKTSIHNNSIYHLVLNPDVTFKSNILEELSDYMDKNKDVGNIMPNVQYLDGRQQYLCKLLPGPIQLIIRRFIFIKSIKDYINHKYELKFFKYNKIANIPSLSGCFMFTRLSALKKVGLFDENFFMYLEDVDLNRRIYEKYKTIFYPHQIIYHGYKKASGGINKEFIAHIKSTVYYFNKWGWIIDDKRKKINNKTIKTLKNMI